MGCTDNNKVRVHPRAQQNQFVRVNGWTRPLHYLQIVAWAILLVFGLVYFGLVAVALTSVWKPAAYVCVGILYFLHCIVHIIAITKNPADENARAQIKQNHQMPAFDRSKHEHVIENEYCNLCETYVSKKSKHCKACNKCVKDFDHHCLWLNNCVGKRNYRYFLASISSALVGVIIITTVSLFVFISAILGFHNLDANVWWRKTSVSWILFETFIGITVLLCIVSMILLGQLLCFHLLLIRRGITTYEYIVDSRSKKRESSGNINAAADMNGAEGAAGSETCALPSSAVQDKEGVTIVKIPVPLDDALKLDNGKNITNKLISVKSPQKTIKNDVTQHGTVGYNNGVKSPSPTRSGQVETQSEFTNEAFAPDETKNFNNNYNNSGSKPYSTNETYQQPSALGELGSWEISNEPKAKADVDGRQEAAVENPQLGLPTEKSKAFAEHNEILTAGENGSDKLILDAKTDGASGKKSLQGRRRRSSKKAMMRHREDGAPRPLPILPEVPNAMSAHGGSPRSRNSPNHLPPLRNSVDWQSSTEDLQSALAVSRKLPPLSASSSTNSLVSYASLGSGSIISSRYSEHSHA